MRVGKRQGPDTVITRSLQHTEITLDFQMSFLSAADLFQLVRISDLLPSFRIVYLGFVSPFWWGRMLRDHIIRTDMF